MIRPKYKHGAIGETINNWLLQNQWVRC